jgi:ABC-type sugar transport system substrate-binding protein
MMQNNSPKIVVASGLTAIRTLLLSMTVMLIGCSNDNNSFVKIGVSVPETTAPVYALLKQGMIEHEKEYGIKIVWNGVRDEEAQQDTAALERRQIQEMFEDGIRVLILNPVDQKAAYPILREAGRWHVPVISLDRMLVSMPVRGHIVVNAIEVGEEAARHAVVQIGYKGNVLVLEGAVGSEALRNISIGIYRVLDQYPDTIRVFSRTLALKADAAFDYTNRMLTNYAGNIQAIIAVNSTLAAGAVRGVQLHGLADQIITVGVGAGEEACRQILLKQHDAEVDLMPYERGFEALKAAIDALHDRPFAYDHKLPNGEIFTKTKFGPIRLITPANSLELERMWPDLFAKQ